jgi:hypothetical protein
MVVAFVRMSQNVPLLLARLMVTPAEATLSLGKE